MLDQVADTTLSSSSIDGSLQVFYRVGESGRSRLIDGHVDIDDVGTLGVSFEPDADPLALELRSDGERAWVSSRDDSEVTAAMPVGVTWVVAPLDDLRALGAYPVMSDLMAAVPLVRGLQPDRDEQAQGGTYRFLVGEVDWHAVVDAATPAELAAMATVIPLGETAPDIAHGLNTVVPFGDIELIATQATVIIDSDERIFALTVSITAESPQGDVTIDLNFAATSYDRDVPAPPEPTGAVALDDVPQLRQLLESEI